MTDAEFLAALNRPLTRLARANAVVLASLVTSGAGHATEREEELAVLVVRFAEEMAEVEFQNAAMRAALDDHIGEWGDNKDRRVLSPRQCKILGIPVADRCLTPSDCEYASRGWCPRCEPTAKEAK